MCVYARQREKGSALHNIKYTFVRALCLCLCTLGSIKQVAVCGSTTRLQPPPGRKHSYDSQVLSFKYFCPRKWHLSPTYTVNELFNSL